ncbi:MAG: T9SS type A sorting domain-containing protein [Bacteroidales bacterium]|jgi:hypothetical protein|nr:T9SS type A sorting domain-containing protein [Bacteroidales bacterium]
MKIRKILLISVFAISSLSMFAQGEKWTKLGPDNIGGRVRSIIFDRFNDNVMYAGGVAGGFFVSVNNGKNWQEISLGNSENSSFAVTSICQSDDGTIYVGTGESYYNSISSQGINNDITGLLGRGIYKLDNWTNADWSSALATDELKYDYVKNNMNFVVLTNTVPAVYDATDEWAYVNDMVCLGNTVYVGLTKGFKYSNDGGTTWQNVTINGSSATGIFVNDIKINKNGRIAVAYGSNDAPVGGQSVSNYKIAISDESNSLSFNTVLEATDLNDTTVSSLGRIELSFGIKDPNTLYAAIVRSIQGYYYMLGVYRTRDLNNVNWTGALAASQVMSFGYDVNTSLCIFVDDRANYEKVYLGSNYLWYGWDNNNSNGLGNYHWSTVAGALIGDTRSSGTWVARNIHNIIIKDNPKTAADSVFMALATDGGVFTYSDNIAYGQTDTRPYVWNLSAKGMNNVQFYDVSVSADASVFGATQSNAIVYIPTNKIKNVDSETGDTVYVNLTTTNGDIIWSPNSEGAYELGAYGYIQNAIYDVSGSAVSASCFERKTPSYVKPVVLSRPYTLLARTYSNKNSFYEINSTTWNFGASVSGSSERKLMPPYMNDANSWSYDPKNTPMFLWESTNATNVRDSATAKIDLYTIVNGKIGGTSTGDTWQAGATIPAGDSILIKSNAYPMNYPFYYTLTSDVTVPADSVSLTFKVQNPVQSRLFVATNSGVYVCSEISNYSKIFIPGDSDNPENLIWAKVFEISDVQNYVIHCLSVSQDGDALFIAVENRNAGGSTLYRITGLASANFSHPVLTSGILYNTLAYDAATTPPLSPAISNAEIILTESRPISSISIDRNNPNILMVTFGTYTNSPSVKVTLNALATAASVTFTDKTGIDNETGQNLKPNKPVYASVIESIRLSNPHTAYIGTEDGVWKTDDFTETPVNWVKMQGIPDVPVFKLTQQTHNLPYMNYITYSGGLPSLNEFCATEYPGAIYAATYGKGLYAYFGDTVAQKDSIVSLQDVERFFAENNNIKLNIYPNPAQNETSIDYFIPAQSKVSFKMFDINGKLISSIERGVHKAGQYTLPLNCNGLKKGIYMIQIITNTEAKTAKLVVQ